MTHYFLPFFALAIFISYRKLIKSKKVRKFTAPPSHQLPS